MNKIIVIAGPTASGKTGAAVELAHRLNGEIISADSMQIYKYMDIGTAKPSEEEMRGIRHYMISELYPDEEFSVAVFQSMAAKYLDEIYQKGKVPIVVGGTGFYINALIKGNVFTAADVDASYRAALYEHAEKYGNGYMHERLRETDPDAADAIHPNNLKRVIRALEYFHLTGEKISEHNSRERRRGNLHDTAFIILNIQREALYERINSRVDGMISAGLVDEVRSLIKMGYHEELTSMQGLGYREIARHVLHGLPLDEAVERIKRNTRHFARRQLTWFRNQNNGLWFNIDEVGNYSIIANGLCEILRRE